MQVHREVILYSGYIWNVNNTETKADHFNVKCFEIATFIKKEKKNWKNFHKYSLSEFCKKVRVKRVTGPLSDTLSAT